MMTASLVLGDLKAFRRACDWSLDALAKRLSIASAELSTFEGADNPDKELPAPVQDRFRAAMKENQYAPGRVIDRFFDSLVESYKILSIEDWEHFKSIYVDPSEFDTVGEGRVTYFDDLCKPEACILIGQRGTGKSTLFAGLAAYFFHANKNRKDKSLTTYIDARAFDEALSNLARHDRADDDLSEGDISQIILQVLATAILRDVPAPYHGVRRGLAVEAAKNLDTQVKDSKTLYQDLMEALSFSFVEKLGSVVRVDTRSAQSRADTESGKLLRAGGEVTDTASSQQHEMNVARKTLFTNAVLDGYRKALAALSYNRVYVCIDDFSLISERHRDSIWNVIRKQYLSKDDFKNFLIFKIATYPGSIYGFDRPNFEDAERFHVDQFRHRQWLEQTFETEDVAGARHVQRVLSKRLASMGLDWAQVFAPERDSEDALAMCRELYYSSSGLTRNAGMVLRQAKAGMGRNQPEKISTDRLTFSGRRFFEEYLFHRLPSRMFFMEDENQKSRLAQLYQELLDALEHEFRDVRQLPTTAFFHTSFAVARNTAEDLIQPLAHVGYIMKRFECGPIDHGATEDDYTKEYSVYSLNYGFVRRARLTWDTQANLKQPGVAFHDPDFIAACRQTSDAFLRGHAAKLLETFRACNWIA